MIVQWFRRLLALHPVEPRTLYIVLQAPSGVTPEHSPELAPEQHLLIDLWTLANMLANFPRVVKLNISFTILIQGNTILVRLD